MKHKNRKLQIKRMLREKRNRTKEVDHFSRQSSQELFFEQYKMYTNEILETFSMATESQYEKLANELEAMLRNGKELSQLRKYVSTGHIDHFLEVLLDKKMDFDVELFYPEGVPQVNGPLSEVLFKNLEIIVDGYRLESLIIKNLSYNLEGK
jgi:hypothetical protein